MKIFRDAPIAKVFHHAILGQIPENWFVGGVSLPHPTHLKIF